MSADDFGQIVAWSVFIGAPLAGALGWFHGYYGAQFPWERRR